MEISKLVAHRVLQPSFRCCSSSFNRIIKYISFFPPCDKWNILVNGFNGFWSSKNLSYIKSECRVPKSAESVRKDREGVWESEWRSLLRVPQVIIPPLSGRQSTVVPQMTFYPACWNLICAQCSPLWLANLWTKQNSCAHAVSRLVIKNQWTWAWQWTVLNRWGYISGFRALSVL